MLLLKLIHLLCILCMCPHLYMCATFMQVPSDFQTICQIPWTIQVALATQCWCWKLNSDSLGEKQTIRSVLQVKGIWEASGGTDSKLKHFSYSIQWLETMKMHKRLSKDTLKKTRKTSQNCETKQNTGAFEKAFQQSLWIFRLIKFLRNSSMCCLLSWFSSLGRNSIKFCEVGKIFYLNSAKSSKEKLISIFIAILTFKMTKQNGWKLAFHLILVQDWFHASKWINTSK